MYYDYFKVSLFFFKLSLLYQNPSSEMRNCQSLNCAGVGRKGSYRKHFNLKKKINKNKWIKFFNNTDYVASTQPTDIE